MFCENTNNYITIYSYFLFELTRLQVSQPIHALSNYDRKVITYR